MGRGKHLKKRLDEQDKTDQALSDLVEETIALVDENPEVADILKMAQEGELPEADALERLHSLVKMKAGPKLTTALDVLASRNNMELGYKPESGAKNLVTLNPLLEAAIAERLQFDEDIPEIRARENFRTAPVPSIQSNIQNPEMLAMCLEQLRAERNQVIRANLEDKKQYAPDLIDAEAPHLADTQITSNQLLLPGNHSGEMTVQRFEIAPGTRQTAIAIHDDQVDAMRYGGAEEARRTATGRLLSTTAGADSLAHALTQRLTWDELLPPFVRPYLLPERGSSFGEWFSSTDQRIPTSLNDQSWNPRFDVISHIYNQIVRPVRDDLRGEIITWALGAINEAQPWQQYRPEDGDIILTRDDRQYMNFVWLMGLQQPETRPESIIDPRIPEGQFFVARGEVFQFWTTDRSTQITHQQRLGERVRVWTCTVSGNFVSTHPENLSRFSFG